MEQWCVNRFLTDEREKVDRVQKEKNMNRAQHLTKKDNVVISDNM